MTPHGTLSRYRYQRCRCEPCREAKAASCREYRERKALDIRSRPRWVKPDDGILDDVAINRVINGDTTVRLTYAERDAAFDLMVSRGNYPSVIGIHLRLSHRDVIARLDTSAATA